MEQFCSINDGGEIQFLPDRYVLGKCPRCSSDGARGDQCDSCGSTYEADELIEPISKLNPEDPVEIRETDHLFFRKIWRSMLQSVRGSGSQMSDP